MASLVMGVGISQSAAAALPSLLATPAQDAQTDVSLVLSGADRMTDRSPADITAVVTNPGDIEVEVDVSADAGRHEARVATKTANLGDKKTSNTVTLKVAPHSAALAFVEVRARQPTRLERAAVVVMAAVRPAAPRPVGPTAQPSPPARPSDPVATRELKVELAGSDLLPGVLGLGSILIVPGLLAVTAALAVWVRDRRKLGQRPRPELASILWGNKLWLLGAGVASLVTMWLYALSGQGDLLDAWSWRDLVVVSVGGAAVSAVLSALVVWVYRRHKPRINSQSSPLDVLRAAARKDGSLFERPVYETSDQPPRCGLLVHEDAGATVLAPPIRFSGPDELVTLWRNTQSRRLKAAISVIKNATPDSGSFSDAGYVSEPGVQWVSEPTVTTDRKLSNRLPESILRYERKPDDS
ncbi:hypothetical protein [Kitasatospora sp. NPDC050543]|uniref:hypothetical protein n=1 Tax=Kitasatospora sp. NPDC050543 TaxID=3364054 RepID=UPI0037ABE4BD